MFRRIVLVKNTVYKMDKSLYISNPNAAVIPVRGR